MGSAIAFDARVHVKKLKAAGFKEEQAETLASTDSWFVVCHWLIVSFRLPGTGDWQLETDFRSSPLTWIYNPLPGISNTAGPASRTANPQRAEAGYFLPPALCQLKPDP